MYNLGTCNLTKIVCGHDSFKKIQTRFCKRHKDCLSKIAQDRILGWEGQD